MVGEKAPGPERAAAERIASTLRQAGGPRDNLVLANRINVELERAATHHLVVVGTESSNRVLERLPSHWALDRDLYYANRAPFESYMPATGFCAAGYGTFTGGNVGYIEWDRNPYWHYATNLLKDRKPEETATVPPLPYRQMVRVTGNTPAGVALAADAFLNRKVITGAITGDGKLPGAMSLWTLDTAHYALPEQAPKWIPASDAADGQQALIFAGWHLADAMLYAGLREITGAEAAAIWRAKFLTERKWDYPMSVTVDPAHPMTRSPLFDATLARRATDNEFLVAKYADAESAATALKAAEAALSAKRDHSHAPWTDVTLGSIKWRRSRFGVHMTAFREFMVMESFDEAHDALALRLISQAMAAEGMKR
ncbi:MAG TPA: hypothetical protein VM223_26005 [Planctomycetota bacterium]|nr:hypothetical protein [Planctomycetota bacterium]